MQQNLKFSAGKYFYVTDNAGIVPLANDGAAEVIPANNNPAMRALIHWPTDETMIINTRLLMEHSIFQGEILKKKEKLVDLFTKLGTNETKRELQVFMENIINTMVEILKLANEMYWVKPENPADRPTIRSQYSFDTCLNNALKFGFEKLRILNIVADVNDSTGLTSAIVNRDINEMITQSLKGLGNVEEKKMRKKGKKN